ncbi:MAG: two-component system sensor histidine kinase NtrB [Blastocatellia bacterium]
MSEHHSLPILPASAASLPPAWEVLFEAIEDGLCVQTPDSRIVMANRAFATMMGLAPEQIIGHTCAEVFSCVEGHAAPPVFCARRAAEHGGQPVTEELSGRQPGQRLRSRVSPVYDQHGQLTAYVMVVRDITDVVARERELARVEQMSRFGDLAAGLAHEIKNPLAGIQGIVDILLQRRGTEHPERLALENIRHEVRRIDETVHLLLDRARPRIPNLRLASLNETVERAVSLAQHQAMRLQSTAGWRINVHYPDPAEAIVMRMDAMQIEDAVLNLLINAIESMEGHGSVTAMLEQRLHDGSAAAVIEVADTGRGIASEHLPRVFSPFFTTRPHGTGLGLPAVRRIARAHGGDVAVSSTPGRGSVFTIHLPLHPTPQ